MYTVLTISMLASVPSLESPAQPPPERAALLVLHAPRDRASAHASEIALHLHDLGWALRAPESVSLAEARLQNPLSVLGHLEAIVETSRAAYTSFDLQRSVALLRYANLLLDRDPWPDAQTTSQHRDLRLLLCEQLLGLAGSLETGRGESPEGQEILQLLSAMLRSQPLLALSPATHTPKLRRLLERARGTVDATPRGRINVTSDPPGLLVWLDGRAIGRTPLRGYAEVPLGVYRVGVASDDHRSPARRVQVTRRPTTLHFDHSAGPAAWRRVDGSSDTSPSSYTYPWLLMTGEFLDVDALVVVEERRQEGTVHLIGVVIDIAQQCVRGWASMKLSGEKPGPSPEEFVAFASALSEARPTPVASPRYGADWIAGLPWAYDDDAGATQRSRSVPWLLLGGGTLLLGGTIAAAALLLPSRLSPPNEIRRIEIDLVKP